MTAGYIPSASIALCKAGIGWIQRLRASRSDLHHSLSARAAVIALTALTATDATVHLTLATAKLPFAAVKLVIDRFTKKPVMHVVGFQEIGRHLYKVIQCVRIIVLETGWLIIEPDDVANLYSQLGVYEKPSIFEDIKGRMWRQIAVQNKCLQSQVIQPLIKNVAKPSLHYLMTHPQIVCGAVAMAASGALIYRYGLPNIRLWPEPAQPPPLADDTSRLPDTPSTPPPVLPDTPLPNPTEPPAPPVVNPAAPWDPLAGAREMAASTMDMMAAHIGHFIDFDSYPWAKDRVGSIAPWVSVQNMVTVALTMKVVHNHFAYAADKAHPAQVFKDPSQEERDKVAAQTAAILKELDELRRLKVSYEALKTERKRNDTLGLVPGPLPEEPTLVSIAAEGSSTVPDEPPVDPDEPPPPPPMNPAATQSTASSSSISQFRLFPQHVAGAGGVQPDGAGGDWMQAIGPGKYKLKSAAASGHQDKGLDAQGTYMDQIKEGNFQLKPVKTPPQDKLTTPALKGSLEGILVACTSKMRIAVNGREESDNGVSKGEESDEDDDCTWKV